MIFRAPVGRKHVGGMSALVLLLSSLLGAASAASSGVSFTLSRWQGPDRYGTAAALAEAAYPGGAGNIVVASGESFPDALSASYLAGYLHAPILLTRAAELPAETSAAVRRLSGHNVYVVGGAAAVGNSPIAQLREVPGVVKVMRVSGLTRFDTSLAVATIPPISAVGRINGAPAALIASGTSFPDALAGSAVAAGAGLPILLTSPNTLAPQALTALRKLGISHVFILGGPAAVTPSVEATLNHDGIATSRLAGADRGSTAAAIATFAESSAGFAPTGVAIARGDNGGAGADALALSALAGVRHEPLLLTSSPTLAGTATLAYLTRSGSLLSGGDVAGGTSAISNALLAQLTATIRNTQPAALQIEVTDLPQAVAGDVSVTGPNGFAKHLTATTTLNNLTPGVYQIMANPVHDQAATTYVATQSSQTATVTAHSTASGVVDYFTQIPATTKAVESSTITAATTGSLTVSGGPELHPGDIVAAGIGPNTPNGLLVKVDTVTSGGAGVQNLNVSQATLTDAIPQGDFSATTTLPTQSIGGSDQAPGLESAHGASLRGGRLQASESNGFSDVFQCGTSGSIQLSGDFHAGITPAIHAQWSLRSGVSVTATATVAGEANFSVGSAEFDPGATPAVHCNFDDPIGRPIFFGPIEFEIGFIPIVIEPSVLFRVEGGISAAASFGTALCADFSATDGLRVDRSGASPISSFNVTQRCGGGTFLNGSASAKVALGPQLTVLVDGFDVLDANIDAGLDLEADTTKTPWWTLDATLQAGATLNSPIFNAKATDDHILDWRHRIESTSDILAVTPEMMPRAKANSPYSVQLTASGGTPPYTFMQSSDPYDPPPSTISLSRNGLLSGTTAGAGGFTVVFTVIDARGVQVNESRLVAVD